MGSSVSTTVPSSSTVSSAPLPRAYDAWFKKSWTQIIVLLGPSRHSSQPPLYAADLPQGWSGELILHAGPSVAHPPLAVARYGHGLHRVVPVDLPRGDAQAVRYAGTRRQRFWFAIQVPRPGGGRRPAVEKFEWRRTSGAALRSLGQSHAGWKLVRVAAPPPAYREKDPAAEDAALAADDGAPDEDGDDRADGLTSDGKEVVALWAPAAARKMSMTAVGRFEFRGSGATGELGQRWALMAVMSKMVVWRTEMQVAMSAAGAGG